MYFRITTTIVDNRLTSKKATFVNERCLLSLSLSLSLSVCLKAPKLTRNSETTPIMTAIHSSSINSQYVVMRVVTVTWTSMLRSVLFLAILATTFLPTTVVHAQERITSQELYDGWFTTNNKRFQALLDVRTQSEWNNGHIENATFIENLASDGTSPYPTLLGCEHCTIVVYCQSGNRAGVAIQKLLDLGFKGELLNGLGVSQFVNAGYTLVKTSDSTKAKCASETTISSNVCENKQQQQDVEEPLSSKGDYVSDNDKGGGKEGGDDNTEVGVPAENNADADTSGGYYSTRNTKIAIGRVCLWSIFVVVIVTESFV